MSLLAASGPRSHAAAAPIPRIWPCYANQALIPWRTDLVRFQSRCRLPSTYFLEPRFTGDLLTLKVLQVRGGTHRVCHLDVEAMKATYGGRQERIRDTRPDAILLQLDRASTSSTATVGNGMPKEVWEIHNFIRLAK